MATLWRKWQYLAQRNPAGVSTTEGPGKVWEYILPWSGWEVRIGAMVMSDYTANPMKEQHSGKQPQSEVSI